MILAVDPQPDSLRDLCEKLRRTFPEETVAAFGNPLDALQFGERNPFELLFTDVRLRPFDGYELIKALRQKRAFRAYVVSGSRDQPDRLDWMNISGSYAKPVSAEELARLKEQLAGEEELPVEKSLFRPSEVKKIPAGRQANDTSERKYGA